MVDWCYLCEKKASPADNVSLHRFPKNAQLRAVWLKACGLTPNEDVRQSFLCSDHFESDDIVRRESLMLGKIKSYLKRTAIPRLLLPEHPLVFSKSDDMMLVTPELEVPPISSAGDDVLPNNNDEKINENELITDFKLEDVDIVEHKVFDSSSLDTNNEDSSPEWKKRRLLEPCSTNETLKSELILINCEYRVASDSPGFTDESFRIIESRCSEEIGIVNLIMDEILMSEETIYSVDDLGNPLKATRALTFMVVSIKESWKIPIGYFFINILSDKDRANILTVALKLLHEVNCEVYSITFDGTVPYINMCSILGANLNYGPNFKPYFVNPSTSEPCYIFYDFNHMITLIRNAFRGSEMMKTADGNYILWSYIQALFAVQFDKKKLLMTNKLMKEHFQYSENMNAELAIDTLSRSVYQDLIFLQKIDDKNIRKEFLECSATALFCLNFNNVIEMLNSKYKFCKGVFNTPLSENNYKKMKENAMQLESYITTLHSENNKRLIYTNMKTGFIGLIIGLRNIFPLFDKIKSLGMSCLPTSKLSQVYIKTFFRVLKSHGRFERPDGSQFQNAYTMLLEIYKLQ